MQPKNKISLFPEYTRYEDYVNTKRHIRGQSRPEVFPIGESYPISETEDGRQQSEGQRISSTIDSRYGSLRNAGETYLKLIGVINKDAQGSRVYDPDGITNTLTNVQKDNLIVEKSNIRRFTPTECEKLQGFEPGWTEGISDSQRYKCLGNAVSCPIVSLVGRRLLNVKTTLKE